MVLGDGINPPLFELKTGHDVIFKRTSSSNIELRCHSSRRTLAAIYEALSSLDQSELW